MTRTPQRQREIDQGLRDETGALTFCLIAEEYQQGLVDYQDGNPPPRVSTASYDLGRDLGRRREAEAEAQAVMLAKINADAERSQDLVRSMLANHPDVLAEFNAQLAAIGPIGGKRK